MKNIIHQIKQQAQLKPLSTAIQSNQLSVSYIELATNIDEVAQRLLQYSIKRLGLYLDNGIDWIVVDLAAARAGITLIPLPWFFSDQQLHHAIKTGRPNAIASSAPIPLQGDSFVYQIRLFQSTSLFVCEANTDRFNDHKSCTKISFTSGTTGSPKGIEQNAELIEDVCHSICELTKDLGIDRHLSLLPYSTLLENICGIYVPLIQGKCIYAVPAKRLGLSANLTIDPIQLCEVLRETSPHSLIVTPQLLKLLCYLIEYKLLDPADLKFIAVGGGHVGAQLINLARSNGLPVFEGYGLTEFSSVATLNTPTANRAHSVGKPLPHVQLCIAPDGEILLSRLNAENTKVGTGDLGSIDSDGFVYISGRKKNTLVLSTGRNVSPEWIEAELQSVDQIRQCLVYGDGDIELSALIVSHPQVSTGDIILAITELNNRLPSYATIAQFYRLAEPFSAENYLMTETGKPRRVEILNQIEPLTEISEFVRLNNRLQTDEINLTQEQSLC